jgi:hypothetical protein
VRGSCENESASSINTKGRLRKKNEKKTHRQCEDRKTHNSLVALHRFYLSNSFFLFFLGSSLYISRFSSFPLILLYCTSFI